MNAKTNIIIIVLITTVDFIAQTTGNNWTRIVSGTNESLSEVDFSGNGKGVIVGSGGKILITNDAGLTWRNSNSGLDIVLRGVSIINDNTIVTVGGDISNDPEKRRIILRTEDGGENWIEQEIAFESSFLSTVHFFTPDRGMISVLLGHSNIIESIITTLDGGENWDVYQGLDRYYHFDDIHFSSPQIGMIVGCSTPFNVGLSHCDAGILLTTDGGINWTSLYDKVDGLVSPSFDESCQLVFPMSSRNHCPFSKQYHPARPTPFHSFLCTLCS